MHPNEKIIRDFYAAFAQRDGKAMAALYHADITFSDPVFPMLSGGEPGAMWQMLCTRGKDLQITLASASGRSA